MRTPTLASGHGSSLLFLSTLFPIRGAAQSEFRGTKLKSSYAEPGAIFFAWLHPKSTRAQKPLVYGNESWAKYS